MKTSILSWVAVFGLTLSGCSDQGVRYIPRVVPEPNPASVSGRVCDADGKVWLADAMVYTNVLDDQGKVVGVRQAYSDRDGYWVLNNLNPDREYTIYVQHESSVIWEDTMFLSDGEEVRLEEPPCFDPQGLNIGVMFGVFGFARREAEFLKTRNKYRKLEMFGGGRDRWIRGGIG